MSATLLQYSNRLPSCADALLISQKGSDFPLPAEGKLCVAGKTRTMENSSYVDNNLLIMNPGSNDGNKQQ